MNKTMIKVTHADRFHTSTTEVYFDGKVYRYATNDRVPPADSIKNFGIDKLPMFDAVAHESVRDEETMSFLETYAEQMRDWIPSGADLHEMRAAFGSGAEVVNVITGKKYKI